MTKKETLEKAVDKVVDKLELEPEPTPEPAKKLTGKAVDHTPIEVYAKKIWNGQSISLNEKTRVERIKKALRNQGYDLRGFKTSMLHD